MTADQGKDYITTSIKPGERTAVSSPALRCIAKGGNKYSFLIEGRRTFVRLPGALPVPWPAVLGTICVAVVFGWWYCWRTRKQVWEVCQATNK